MGIFYLIGMIVSLGLILGLCFTGKMGKIDEDEYGAVFILVILAMLASWVGVIAMIVATKIEKDTEAEKALGGRYMIPLNKITKEQIESIIRCASPRASIFYEDLDVISDAIVTHYTTQKVEYEEEEKENIVEKLKGGLISREDYL